MDLLSNDLLLQIFSRLSEEERLEGGAKGLPSLRQLSLLEVPVSTGLAAALAGLPGLHTVRLEALRGPPPSAARPHLARLGTRLESLFFWFPRDGSPVDADGICTVPPGLLACTGLGHLAMVLASDNGWPHARLAGLDLLPALHEVHAHGGVPREVWTCPGLASLHVEGNPVGLPAASLPASQLALLTELHLSGWDSVCQLSALPPGPYLEGPLAELDVSGNLFQPNRVPAALGAATALERLAVSWDCDPAMIWQQWPAAESTLCQLEGLQSLSVSFLDSSLPASSMHSRHLVSSSEAEDVLHELVSSSELALSLEVSPDLYWGV
ncbi:hypothetical protein ABPG75_004123 [Micractinium tetrahymenae]